MVLYTLMAIIIAPHSFQKKGGAIIMGHCNIKNILENIGGAIIMGF